MGSPNSSYVWIQFMAHLVSLGQLAAARAAAERALGTIGFRCAARPADLRVRVSKHGLRAVMVLLRASVHMHCKPVAQRSRDGHDAL